MSSNDVDDRPAPDPRAAYDAVWVALAALGEPDGYPDLDDWDDPLYPALSALCSARDELHVVLHPVSP